MEINRLIEISRIEELKILHDVRLIHKHDLNPIQSNMNLRVQFEVSGDIRGTITCHLCLDNKELTQIDQNYVYPLFVESMNILIGRQISLDKELRDFKIKLSPPKLNMNPQFISTSSARGMTHKYELELESMSFDVLTQYSLEIYN